MIAGRKRQTLAQARHFGPLGLGEILASSVNSALE
jgi:hypothetical protein